MFIDGGIRAREWLSPAIMTILINELRVHALDALNVKYLQAIEFHIVPVWNVDGYNYSWILDHRPQLAKKPSTQCELELCMH